VVGVVIGGVMGGVHDTTNIHNQYQILNTVSHIVKHIIKEGEIEYHTVTFKSSEYRNGEDNIRSGEIRDRFFTRYVLREHPYAEVLRGDNNSVIIILR